MVFKNQDIEFVMEDHLEETFHCDVPPKITLKFPFSLVYHHRAHRGEKKIWCLQKPPTLNKILRRKRKSIFLNATKKGQNAL